MDGVFYNEKLGRIVEHHGHSTRIHWSKQMLDYIKRHFPTTTNEELAGCLGVSRRTLIRKARELGLQKDPQWLADVWDENRAIGHSFSKVNGNKGWFKKGHHASSETEFKPGHKHSEETTAKLSASMKRWHLTHRTKSLEKLRKAWEARRNHSVTG